MNIIFSVTISILFFWSIYSLSISLKRLTKLKTLISIIILVVSYFLTLDTFSFSYLIGKASKYILYLFIFYGFYYLALFWTTDLVPGTKMNKSRILKIDATQDFFTRYIVPFSSILVLLYIINHGLVRMMFNSF